MHIDLRKVIHKKSVLDHSLIQRLYDCALNEPKEAATVGKIVNGEYTTAYSKWCTANFIDYNNHVDDVMELVNVCKTQAQSLFNVTCLEHQIHFLHYTTGTKYYPHVDGQYIEEGIAKRGVERDITCVAYLNDNYDGGLVNFNLLDIKVKPSAGDVLFYPTTYQYIHSVDEVIGDRYAVVIWFKTDPMLNNDTVISDNRTAQYLKQLIYKSAGD